MDIFRRSWFRSYAAAIGVDADAALREFVARHPDPEVIAEPPAPPQRGPEPALRRIAGALASLSRFRGRREARVAPPPKLPVIETPTAPPSESPDLPALARLCTELGRVTNAKAVPSLLEQTATLLDASGLSVWVWDRRAEALKPALVHGYAQNVIARLPPVTRARRTTRPRQRSARANRNSLPARSCSRC